MMLTEMEMFEANLRFAMASLKRAEERWKLYRYEIGARAAVEIYREAGEDNPEK